MLDFIVVWSCIGMIIAILYGLASEGEDRKEAWAIVLICGPLIWALTAITSVGVLIACLISGRKNERNH